MRRDRDGSLDGRLNMSNHRISGLADPTDADDAVTRRYVASLIQAEVQDNKSKLDALQNLLGIESNQVLFRKYELLDADFYEYYSLAGADEGTIRSYFIKYPSAPDVFDAPDDGSDFFGIFTLKEYFLQLFGEPVDDSIWLRIKQPGTYTIHFDLIIEHSSFSFELHTRDEIIHFSEYNPKHDSNLEKGENCLLVSKKSLNILV